jgi:hypothetical protein
MPVPSCSAKSSRPVVTNGCEAYGFPLICLGNCFLEARPGSPILPFQASGPGGPKHPGTVLGYGTTPGAACRRWRGPSLSTCTAPCSRVVEGVVRGSRPLHLFDRLGGIGHREISSTVPSSFLAAIRRHGCGKPVVTLGNGLCPTHTVLQFLVIPLVEPQDPGRPQDDVASRSVNRRRGRGGGGGDGAPQTPASVRRLRDRNAPWRARTRRKGDDRGSRRDVKA